MEQVTSIIIKFLNGKSIFTPIRRILNIIFIASISSYLFEYYSGKYEWLDYNDYKGILDFFVKGIFIIPLTMYLIVYYGTTFISSYILPALILKRVLKYQEMISGLHLKSENLELNELTNENFLIGENLSKYFSTPNCLLDLYEYITASLKGRITFEKVIIEINRGKNEIQLTLNLLFRALIAIILYFIKLPAMGAGLFVTLLITTITMIIIFIIGLLLLDVLPNLIQKLKYEMDKLLELRKNNPKTG